MAGRLPSSARTSLLSFPSAKHMTTCTRRSLSTSLIKSTDRYPAFKRLSPSPRRKNGRDSKSRDLDAYTSLAGTYWTKSLFLGQVDDSSANPGHTLFTSPGVTKTAVIDMIKLLEMPSARGNAAVVFASPRHASWLTDTAFMAGLTQVLLRRRSEEPEQTKVKQTIHILAAAVDGLYPNSARTGREMQEGLSIQFGSLDRLLPGLWDEVEEETPETIRAVEPGFESANVSVVFSKSAYQSETYTVTLPLANTLFHNGRRTTLLASEWLADASGDQSMNLLRIKEKRMQTIVLPVPSTSSYNKAQQTPLPSALVPTTYPRRVRVLCPLVPITHPRKIVEGLGNILAKVDINGEPSPASKEIQVNIPLWLQARQPRSDVDPKSARIGVWALIMPERLFLNHEGPGQTSIGATTHPSLRFNPSMRMHILGTAIDKLAFEMEDDRELTAWQRSNMMGEILLQGGRLHQILSGGGEWGAKASLLSLDPQTSHGVQSEDDELDRFQRSFHGQDTADGATTRPGDFVQFFVEGDSKISEGYDGSIKPMRISRASYPVTAFGVSEFSKEGCPPEQVDASLQTQRKLVQLAPCHFGGFSAEGVYLDMKGGHATKLNTPGIIIHSSA